MQVWLWEEGPSTPLSDPFLSVLYYNEDKASIRTRDGQGIWVRTLRTHHCDDIGIAV